MEYTVQTDFFTELREARKVIAKVSEWADGMPGAAEGERLTQIRRLVRTYERDVLGIVTAPVDEPGPAVQS